MKSILSYLWTLLAALAVLFLSLASTSCAAAASTAGTGTAGKPAWKPSLAFDLANGVCVKTDRGSICYNPLTNAWSLKVPATGYTEALTVVRRDDESVTLSTASGGTLTYRNGQVEWPGKVDRGK